MICASRVTVEQSNSAIKLALVTIAQLGHAHCFSREKKFSRRFTTSSRSKEIRTENTPHTSIRWLVLVVSLTVWSGCSLQPLQQQSIGDLGHVEFRKSAPQSAGVVIGAPHGTTEPVAADYATGISNTTGAGLMIAYGFQSKRIAVTKPLVRMFSPLSEASDPRRRGSIYPEFKRLLQKTVNGPLKLYVGILMADAKSNLDHVEVATSGLSFEELKLLKASFIQIRDQTIQRMHALRLEMALDPLDEISWRTDGVKHHGVLMVAERGINIRLPTSLSGDTARDAYENILSEWIQFATEIARGSIG